MEDLQRQINELKAEIDKLKNTTTIPLEVDRAFRDRFNMDNFTVLATSTKTVLSESQSVDEAGTDTYDVLKPPAGFRQFFVGGTALYIPYYL